MQVQDIEAYQQYVLDRTIKGFDLESEELGKEVEVLCVEFDRLENYHREESGRKPTSRWKDLSKQYSGMQLLYRMLKMERLFADYVKIGLLRAQEQGRTGGRPSEGAQFESDIKQMVEAGDRVVDIVEKTGLSRSTVQRMLRDMYVAKDKRAYVANVVKLNDPNIL